MTYPCCPKAAGTIGAAGPCVNAGCWRVGMIWALHSVVGKEQDRAGFLGTWSYCLLHSLGCDLSWTWLGLSPDWQHLIPFYEPQLLPQGHQHRERSFHSTLNFSLHDELSIRWVQSDKNSSRISVGGPISNMRQHKNETRYKTTHGIAQAEIQWLFWVNGHVGKRSPLRMVRTIPICWCIEGRGSRGRSSLPAFGGKSQRFVVKQPLRKRWWAALDGAVLFPRL